MKIFFKVILIIVFITLCALSLTVFCSAKTAEISVENFGGDVLYKSVPDEAKTLLEKLGIDEIDFDSIFNLRAIDIASLIKNLVT